MNRRIRGSSGRRLAALRSWTGRISLLIGILCMVIGVISPSASASFAMVAAEARCDRVVSWVVSSSGDGDSPERANEKVEVSYRSRGESGPGDWKFVRSVVLDAAGDFSASGSFSLPDGVDAVDIRAAPKAKWGDGTSAGDPRYAIAEVPAECGAMPVVATIEPDCDAGGAVLQTRNLDDSPAELVVSVDGVEVRAVTLGARERQNLVVPILDGTSSVIRVNSGDFVVAQRKVSPDCGRQGPEASVLERCPGRQAIVSASLNGERSRPIQVRAGGTIIHRGELSPDETFRRALDLPPTGFIPIEVQVDSEVVAVGQVGDCDQGTLGIVSCGGSGRPACRVATEVPDLPPPPAPPPSLVIEVPSGTLPVTGPWQRAIVLILGGCLLAGGGALVMAEQGRRPKPSLLAAAVDDYRRQWWQ